MPTPDMSLPTDFELRLSDAIDAAWGGGSGTVWGDAGVVLASGLGLQPTEVGLISVTNPGVVNNRPLSAGLITAPRRLLVIPIADEVGLARQEQAIVSLMPKTRHLTTVALATRVSDPSHGDVWRVQRLIEIDGLGIATRVLSAFPAVQNIRREPLVPFGQSPAETGGELGGTDAHQQTGQQAWFVEDDETTPRYSTSVDSQVASAIRIGDTVVLGSSNGGDTVARSVAKVSGLVREADRVRVLFEDRYAVAEEHQKIDLSNDSIAKEFPQPGDGQ